MGTIIKNTTSAFVDGQQITSTALNALIDDAILNTTAVSAGTGLTVNASTGVLSMDTSLTGKTLTGGSLNNCPIGASTPNTGAFTTLSASGGFTGNVTGNVTGNLTGNVTGDVTGNISGNVTGGTGAFTTLTASDDANFDSGTLFVDASASKVGVLHATPDEALQVVGNIRIGNDSVADMLLKGATAPAVSVGGSAEAAIVTTRGVLAGAFHVGVEVPANDPDDGFYVATDANTDGTVDTVALKIRADGNVGIGTTSPSQLLDVNGQARIVGNLFVGTDDTTPNGMIEVYGGGTGQDEGGEIRLRTGADYDTTYNHYFIDAYQDDFRIGRAGAADITLTSDGNLGIGDTSPSAPLTVTSTTGGVLLPRMTTTQMNAISSPANGEIIYNTTASKFYGYAGGTWVALH